MATQIDPVPYLRFVKPDVAGAVFLAKRLLQRVPEASSPPVRTAVAHLQESLDDLREKWSQQPVLPAVDLRPLVRRLGGAWSAIRTRLLACDAFPEGHPDRVRAGVIHDLLFPEGLEFTQLPFSHLHSETERRLLIIDERGHAKDLARLVGDDFLVSLRAAYQAAGDALGVNKPIVPSAPVFVAEPLRVLIDAITGYALQLLAVARLDPEKRDAVLFALGPIDEYRASVRRSIARDDESIDQDEGEEENDVADDAVVTPLPTPAPIALAPVA